MTGLLLTTWASPERVQDYRYSVVSQRERSGPSSHPRIGSRPSAQRDRWVRAPLGRQLLGARAYCRFCEVVGDQGNSVVTVPMPGSLTWASVRERHQRPSLVNRTRSYGSEMRDHGPFADRSGECEHRQDAFLDVTLSRVDGSGRRGGLQERLFDSSRRRNCV
jgi:hypothetical protein